MWLPESLKILGIVLFSDPNCILRFFIYDRDWEHSMEYHPMHNVVEHDTCHSPTTCRKPQFIHTYDHTKPWFVGREIATEAHLILIQFDFIIVIIVFARLRGTGFACYLYDR